MKEILLCLFLRTRTLKLLKLSIQRLDYLDDLLNIDNTYFDGMVKQIYPSELQLNKTNSSDTEALFLDLHFF